MRERERAWWWYANQAITFFAVGFPYLIGLDNKPYGLGLIQTKPTQKSETTETEVEAEHGMACKRHHLGTLSF